MNTGKTNKGMEEWMNEWLNKWTHEQTEWLNELFSQQIKITLPKKSPLGMPGTPIT